MSCFDCKKMHEKCKAQCCGIVPIHKQIYYSNQDKIVRKPHDLVFFEDCVIPVTSEGNCVFLNTDLSCNIYEDRPDVCRKFGNESHPMLFCPVLDKHGKERSRQSQRKIQRDSNKYISKLNILNDAKEK